MCADLETNLCCRSLKFVKKLKSVPCWESKVEVEPESGRGSHNKRTEGKKNMRKKEGKRKRF